MLKAQYEWIIWVAAAAVIISLGAHASRVVRFLLDQNTGPEVRRAYAEVVEPRIDIDAVLTWMPFGQSVGATPSNAAGAGDTRLTLLGIVRANSVSRSSAIVSVGNEPAQSFFVGDEIPGGRRLVEIQGDHILMEAGVLKETLSFTDTSPPVLQQSDSVSRTAGATDDLDALRKLIFDQANNQGDTALVPLPRDEDLN